MKKTTKNKRIKKISVFLIFLSALCVFGATQASASVTFDFSDLDTPSNIADSVNILLLLTVIALAPSILVLMTGFTRILIVMSFTRNAMGLQQTPPNQVMIGLALFLTFFIMSPIFAKMNDEALQPYIAEEIEMDEALGRAVVPMREFMLAQMKPEDLNTFLSIADQPRPGDLSEISIWVIIPAFILSEIKWAFMLGFYLYIPFLIIDLVEASTLMSLGMMMLPPAMVSMPFKLMIFLLFDGWGLIVTSLMASFKL